MAVLGINVHQQSKTREISFISWVLYLKKDKVYLHMKYKPINIFPV